MFTFEKNNKTMIKNYSVKIIGIAISVLCFFSNCATDEKPAATNSNATPVETQQTGNAPLVTPNFGATPADVNATPNPTASAQPAPAPAPAVNTNIPNYEKFAHFICPKACKGSGSEVFGGKCPVCATAYVHNENSDGHRAEMARVKTVDDAKVNMQFTDTVVSIAKPSNYEKVAHYICSKGCKGSGSEAPGKCPTCSSEYAHNNNSLHHEYEDKLKLQKH